jgi:crotonobetainyl-CoA:carnitine CoA-transferase CaiB-like acyl-CoA transferase
VQLLTSLRVLDMSSGDADVVTRLLADLGADVLKVEPPGGDTSRAQLPSVGGVSIPFALHNANKRSVVLDPEAEGDRERFFKLAETADILVDSGIPGQTALFGTSCPALATQFGHLVALSVTDFSTAGPYASWQATDPVLYALATELSRSGPTSGTPVLPPDGIASATAAVQAAWATLVAYYNRLRYGSGDYIDFSRFEAVVQALDPPFGSVGQAAAGVKPSEVWRGRPKNQDVYPIFACADGHVRICVLSPRQWRGMRAWLGEPGQFQDPRYDTLGARFAATQEIGALIAELFARRTMDELVCAGQSHGVPIAAVLTPSEVLRSDHFRAVGALTEVALAPGTQVKMPVGYFLVDGQRAGLRHPAPLPGADAPQWLAPAVPSAPTGAFAGRRPFDGIRVLDLGVIVAGGELGRLFADLGAEVIKVESATYPDGLRQARAGAPMSESFAIAHRNECGLGLDLRHRDGAAVFGRLVAGADAVFANFKPGTLASLGFSYQTLRSLNPGIVLAESSAFGDSGPWSVRMGYGPLVRAATGITRLWAAGDAADGGRAFYDATTIFPDHVVARITAIAALAALIRRDRAGVGAHVHISQAETAVNQLDTRYVTEAARDAGLPVCDDRSIHGVYPCAGDDEWCVISIRGDADRTALAAVLGCAELPTERSALAAAVGAWTGTLDKAVVTGLLQTAGVPAGPMNRTQDILDDPQVRLRKLFTDMVHPLFDAPMPSETGPAPYLHIPPAELRPAPIPGEHTREICQKVLAMDARETQRLIAEGALFAPAELSDSQPRSSS